ncbi:unnamed protein product [Arctogadus glacialis]
MSGVTLARSQRTAPLIRGQFGGAAGSTGRRRRSPRSTGVCSSGEEASSVPTGPSPAADRHQCNQYGGPRSNSKADGCGSGLRSHPEAQRGARSSTR